MRLVRQFGQLAFVQFVRQTVMGRQGNMEILVRIPKPRIIPPVKQRTTLRSQLILTHFIQQLHERLILLAEHMIQLHINRLQLLHHLRLKEIRSVVILPHRLFIIAPRHYRRQLKQVADHHQLHTAERLIFAVFVSPQDGVYRIQYIRPNHTDLVDDQHLQMVNQIPFALRKSLFCKQLLVRLRRRNKCPNGQLKERMNGHSAGIDCRHTGRSHNHHILRSLFS